MNIYFLGGCKMEKKKVVLVYFGGFDIFVVIKWL